MKKKKIWIIAIMAVAVVGLVFIVINNKVSVNASPIALTEQGWKANFSSSLQQKAVEKGDVYITDAQNERVEAEMYIQDNGKTLEIAGITTGEYRLHIKRAALVNSFIKSLIDTEIPFSVQEQLEKLSGEEQLRDYFNRLMEIYKDNRQFSGGMEEASESTDSASNEGKDSIGEGDYSTTNTQVEGVDEADLVKTDGSYIYSISESKVVISPNQ